MKQALIITDGTESIQLFAQSIKNALSGFKVKICPAEKFAGTDLLAADIFFIGCEKPNPASFSYLEEILAHINLASRKCGVFSVKEKSVNYLQKILKNCEADLAPPLLAENGKVKKSDLNNCLKKVLKEK